MGEGLKCLAPGIFLFDQYITQPGQLGRGAAHQRIIEGIVKTVNKRLKFYDLDTMNIACNSFKAIPFTYGTFQSIMYNEDVTKANEYGFLKGIYTVDELKNARENTILIHYAGEPGKPWRMKNPYPDYKKYMDELPSELKQFTLRDLRKKIFSKN